MKDITVILNRMKQVNVEGMESIKTIQAGLDILANNMIFGNDIVTARNLFTKFAVYDFEYVIRKYPNFYPLIKDAVEEKKSKTELRALKMAGLTTEQAEAELQRDLELNALGDNRLLGYARVSTKEQNLGRQIKSLTEAGCGYIFQEKKSGKNTDREEFNSLMSHVKEGDTVLVSELTRLARSTSDLFNIVQELADRGVAFKSLKESWIDTTTAHGRLMLTMLAGISQFERELTLERQEEGIAVAKDNGVKFGRKLKEGADEDLALQLYREGKYTQAQICTMCNISRATLNRRIKAIKDIEK